MADFSSLEELRDVVAETPVAEAAPRREPQRDSLGRSYATGKRKDAVARVWIKPGNGKVTVNGKEMGVYFARPVLQMLIFTVIFGRMAKMPSGGVPYPVFVYSGLLAWNYFASATAASITSLVSNASLLSKVYFPRLIIPLSSVLSALVDLSVG